jgi:hypothetical protein
VIITSWGLAYLSTAMRVNTRYMIAAARAGLPFADETFFKGEDVKRFWSSWRMTLMSGEDPKDFGAQPNEFNGERYRGAWWYQQTQDSNVYQPTRLDMTDLDAVNRHP